jgi:hypothetical protein
MHPVVLDDVFWHGAGDIGDLRDRQVQWLAADLALVEAGRSVVVLTHTPAHPTRSARNPGSSAVRCRVGWRPRVPNLVVSGDSPSRRRNSHVTVDRPQWDEGAEIASRSRFAT